MWFILKHDFLQFRTNIFGRPFKRNMILFWKLLLFALFRHGYAIRFLCFVNCCYDRVNCLFILNLYDGYKDSDSLVVEKNTHGIIPGQATTLRERSVLGGIIAPIISKPWSTSLSIFFAISVGGHVTSQTRVSSTTKERKGKLVLKLCIRQQYCRGYDPREKIISFLFDKTGTNFICVGFY